MDELVDELRVLPIPESKRIELWRTHVLIEAGYPRLCAERMAELSEIDLHVAVELVVRSGCDPYLAERILS